MQLIYVHIYVIYIYALYVLYVYVHIKTGEVVPNICFFTGEERAAVAVMKEAGKTCTTIKVGNIFLE